MIDNQDQKIINLYSTEKNSMNSVRLKIGVGPKHIRAVLLKHGIEIRPSGSQGKRRAPTSVFDEFGVGPRDGAAEQAQLSQHWLNKRIGAA